MQYGKSELKLQNSQEVENSTAGHGPNSKSLLSKANTDLKTNDEIISIKQSRKHSTKLSKKGVNDRLKNTVNIYKNFGNYIDSNFLSKYTTNTGANKLHKKRRKSGRRSTISGNKNNSGKKGQDRSTSHKYSNEYINKVSTDLSIFLHYRRMVWVL